MGCSLKFLQLIRFKNLLLILGIQLLSIYIYYDSEVLTVPAATFFVALLSFFVSAAGYIINDIFDVEIDRINKPTLQVIGNGISKMEANYIYIILLSLGLPISIYLDVQLSRLFWVPFFVALSAVCFCYSFWFKKRFLIGNLLVALMSGLAVIIVLFPALMTNPAIVDKLPRMIVFLFIFSVLVTFYREIVKDTEDLEGDLLHGASTVPIVIGIRRTKKLLIMINITVVGLLMAYLKVDENSLRAILYVATLVTLQIFYCYIMVLVVRANDKHHFSAISKLLKVSILLGLSVAALGT